MLMRNFNLLVGVPNFEKVPVQSVLTRRVEPSGINDWKIKNLNTSGGLVRPQPGGWADAEEVNKEESGYPKKPNWKPFMVFVLGSVNRIHVLNLALRRLIARPFRLGERLLRRWGQFEPPHVGC